MKMRGSNIFDEYAKLAEERGLLSDNTPIKKQAAEKNDWDYSTFTDAEILYGITPDGQKEGETIAEKAHPESFAVAPAYDAMNAIVEDLYQRQSIMTYVALKNPNGFTSQRRYVVAGNELLNSLISTGFQMDAENQEDLMKLADSCAARLEKKAALPFLVYPALALISAIGYLSYGRTGIQNVYANSERVIKLAQELTDQPYAAQIIDLVSKLKDTAYDFAANKNTIIANSLDDVVNQSGTVQSKQMIDLIDRYKKEQLMVLTQIPKWIEVINLSKEQSTESESDTTSKITGFFSNILPDSWQTYFSDSAKANDLVDELSALQDAINESQKTLHSVQQMAAKYSEPVKQKIQELAANDKEPAFDPNTQFPDISTI